MQYLNNKIIKFNQIIQNIFTVVGYILVKKKNIYMLPSFTIGSLDITDPLLPGHNTNEKTQSLESLFSISFTCSFWS